MYCRELAETPSPQPSQQLDPAAQFTEVSDTRDEQSSYKMKCLHL